MTIHFSGEGRRRVRLGYVVETPVWKTSYRLILDGAKGARQHLQGWAIIENQTDNDWNDVQLSLVSGRPISFIQDLYQPLYVSRPVVKAELHSSLKPQNHEAGVAESHRFFMSDHMIMACAAPAASHDAGNDDDVMGVPELMDATASIASAASAARVGELFQYTVGSVSLPRQRSAMIPIITDPLEVERLSIYNQSVLAQSALWCAAEEHDGQALAGRACHRA